MKIVYAVIGMLYYLPAKLAKSTNFKLATLWLYRKIGVSTSSQNLIHFAIRCHRENIWVLQLNIADSEKSIIVYYAVWGGNWTFHVECDMSSMSWRRVPYTSHETKVQFRRLLYIIFFITQIHKVRFVSVNGEASRVNLSKKILEQNFRKKMLEKKCWEKNFGK